MSVIMANCSRACLKNHSHNLHAPLCGIFCPNSVAVARYGALIRTKSPTNCDAHLAESLFQTRSRSNRCPEAVYCWNSLSAGQQASGLHLETAEFQSTSIGQNSLPTSVKKYRFSTFALPVTSEFTMYIREQVISGALLTETRSMSYVDLAERALPSGLVAVRH